MRHNNPLPNHYHRKHWEKRVKTWFDQPSKKKRRRLARKAKAEKLFPRPVEGPLRPIVQCPTFKHNLKSRFGRGFTLEELKSANLNDKTARTIGIAVDYRRKNRCSESLDLNVSRLKKYLANLIIFPKKMGVIKPGDSAETETAMATQYTEPIYPPVKEKTTCSFLPKTSVDRAISAYKTITKARGDQRNFSYRQKKAQAVAV